MPQAAGLYYEWHGRADAPPLILSPGLGGSGRYWRSNLASFAQHHRVLVYDHRGTGRSDRELPETVVIQDLADDVLALMDALGLRRAHFVGHAAGAVAGLALALAAPERLGALVAVNGWPRCDWHFARCFDIRLELLRASGPAAYLRAQPIFLYPARWSSACDGLLTAAEEDGLAEFPEVASVEKRIAALRNFDIDARLPEIATPALILAAEDDILVPPSCSERLAAGMPHAELNILPWGAHACNITNPALFCRIVIDFLARHPLKG